MLDAGKVVEFDTPFALLKPCDDGRAQSTFSKIVKETGEAQYANLLQMAKNAQDQRNLVLSNDETKSAAAKRPKPAHRGSTYHKRVASVAAPKKGDNLVPPPLGFLPRVPTAPSNVPATPVSDQKT